MKDQDILRKRMAQDPMGSNQTKSRIEAPVTQLGDIENLLKRLTECLASMDVDPLKNVRRLTALCGELMGATCALYNRLHEGMLCSWGQWNVPPEYNPVDTPEGHICYDVINKYPDKVMVVRNLPQTEYVKTDPNVKEFGLQTYIGKAIKLNGEAVGSLCVVYQKDFVPSDQYKELMAAIGAAIGIEEKRREAELKVRKQEAFIDSTLNTLSDLFIMVDLDGKLVRWNSSFNRVTGYDDFEIGDMLAVDFISSDDRIQVKEAMRTIIEEGRASFQLSIVTQVGKVIPYLFTGDLLHDDENNPFRVCLVGRDITERMRAEKELQIVQDDLERRVNQRTLELRRVHEELALKIEEREVADKALEQSETRYRTLIESAKDVIWSIDLDLKYTYISPSIKRLLGYTVEEMMEMEPLETLTPNSRQRILKLYAQELGISGEEPLDANTAASDEIEQYHQDGSIKTIEVTATYIHDLQGRPTGILGISRDVTERKRAEEALKMAHDELEHRVEERTQELYQANQSLELEIADHRRTEYALRESEQRYRIVVDNSSEVIFVSQGGRIVFANAEALKRSGYSLEEFQSKSFLEIIHPDDREMVAENHQRRLRGEDVPSTYSLRAIDKDGATWWAYANVVSIMWEGKPAFLTFGTDITELKQKEQMLKESEANYRFLAENMHDIVWIADLDFHTQYVSPSVQRILGYTPEERKGQPVSGQLSPESLDLAKKILAEELQRDTEEGVDLNRSLTLELEFFRKDGTKVCLETILSFVRNEDSTPKAIYGLSRDITDRKRVERALRESEEKYRQIVERANDGIALIQDGVVKHANPSISNVLGYELQEQIGQPFSKYIHPSVLPETIERYKKRIAGEDVPSMYETILQHKDGSKIFVEVNAGLIELDGKPADLVILRDITERKKREAQLRESEQRYRELAQLLPVFVCEIDRTGQLTFVNEIGLKWTGYTRQDIDTGISAFHVIADEERMRIVENAKRLLRGKHLEDNEFVIHRKDGTTFPAVTYSASIVRDGKIVGFRVVGIDISERKLLEEMLRESESRFRAIFESATDCIYIKDRHLKYTHVNPAMHKLFGLPFRKLLGKTDKDLFGKEAGTHLEKLDQRVLRGQSIEEEHSRNVGGISMTFLDTRVPIRASNGAITGLFGIARDVTGRSPNRIYSSNARLKYISPKYLSTLERARIAANSNSVLLITGETGSGKDHLAKYIHSESPRCANPFLVLNCAAVTSSLAESELFGHESGAFTGVKGRKRGLLELAEGGTLLLNEIGELSLELQAKLLTFLDTKIVYRVGGEKAVAVDARIIAATNRDLKLEMEKGRFRQDLFHRLNVIPIEVPPLRERKEDIPLVAREILTRVADEMGLREVPELSQESIDALVDYDWPGNVRELRNALERSIMLSPHSKQVAVHMSPIDSHKDWSITVTFPENRSVNQVSDEIKRALVVEALKRSGGKKTQAAELLGISRHALKRLVKALTLDERKPLH